MIVAYDFRLFISRNYLDVNVPVATYATQNLLPVLRITECRCGTSTKICDIVYYKELLKDLDGSDKLRFSFIAYLTLSKDINGLEKLGDYILNVVQSKARQTRV